MHSENEDKNIVTTVEETAKHAQVCQFHRNQLKSCNKIYTELLTELFFLQHGGNYSDYLQFKKRPSQQLVAYLEQNPIVTISNIKQSVPVEQPEKVVTHEKGIDVAKESVSMLE